MSELAQTTQFHVLGTLRVRTPAGELAIGAVRERTVLAMLLLLPGETITVQRLVDAVWGVAPPLNARNQLQGCVSRLRKQLLAAGASQIIATTAHGFQIDVEPHQLDLLQFRRRREEARTARENDELEHARNHYRSGLGLWRGSVLSDVESPVVQLPNLLRWPSNIRTERRCVAP
jgi:DNA-binding SARP family transcriptional activator